MIFPAPVSSEFTALSIQVHCSKLSKYDSAHYLPLAHVGWHGTQSFAPTAIAQRSAALRITVAGPGAPLDDPLPPLFVQDLSAFLHIW